MGTSRLRTRKHEVHLSRMLGYPWTSTGPKTFDSTWTPMYVKSWPFGLFLEVWAVVLHTFGVLEP